MAETDSMTVPYTSEQIGAIYDKAYAAGHRCGYMDAVGEVWKYTKDIPTEDPRFAVLADLTRFLQERRDRALEH